MQHAEASAHPATNAPGKQFSANQRKCASYKLVGSAADGGDDSEGHGTHVAGTLSGSFLSFPCHLPPCCRVPDSVSSMFLAPLASPLPPSRPECIRRPTKRSGDRTNCSRHSSTGRLMRPTLGDADSNAEGARVCRGIAGTVPQEYGSYCLSSWIPSPIDGFPLLSLFAPPLCCAGPTMGRAADGRLFVRFAPCSIRCPSSSLSPLPPRPLHPHAEALQQQSPV